MHRRGILFLLCFLVAVVVVGGSGVRVPWAAVQERVATTGSTHVGSAQVAVTLMRVRVE